MHTSRVPCGLILAFVYAVAACSSPAVPAAADTESGDAAVAVAGPKKYDILWVIDHTLSMADHQRGLTQAIPQFVQTLQAKGGVDVRTAVVTVQQLPDPASTYGITVKQIGAFRHEAALSFPPNAAERFIAPCYVDGPVDATTPSAQCRDGFDFTYVAGVNYKAPATSLLKTGNAVPPYGDVVKHYAPSLPGKDVSSTNQWRCAQPNFAAGVSNDNGSSNSHCWWNCWTDAQCQQLFQDPKMICHTPGGASGDPKLASCQLPPDTQDCPPADALPAVLGNDQLSLLHCIAAVGISATEQSTVEGGLRSAWLALDPAGPNCPDAAHCQNQQLLRDDATLVLVFIADEDDCSVALDQPLPDAWTDTPFSPHTSWGNCQFVGDAAGGDPALAEAECLYLKYKQTNPAAFLCPSDCTATDAACVGEAAKNVSASKPLDKRFGAVADFLAKFKTLKAKPEQLVVAAITGDSPDQAFSGGQQAALSAQVHTDRVMFLASALVSNASSRIPHICQSGKSQAGYGSRYLQLAAALGANGWAANLCDDLPMTLTNLATFLANRP